LGMMKKPFLSKGLEARGKRRVLKGHGFNRAAKAS